MKLILVLILCFNFFCTSFSQVQKSNSIEEVFQKEFSAVESENDLSLVTPPVVLPDWFFNPPQGSQDCFYAIGVSDPWIDKERGNQQAKCRAFCLASFMNKVSTKGISDLYNINDNSYKFEQITHFNALPNNDLESFVIDSFVTKYKEYLLLYKFTPGKNKSSNNSSIEYYKSTVEQESGYTKQEKIEMTNQTVDAKMKYKFVMKNNDFEIESLFNSDTIVVKPIIYHYTGRITANDTIEEISFFKKGLWQGYFLSLIDNLDMFASNIAAKQKSVSEIYKKNEGSDNLNQLNREVYNTSFSFTIKTIEITDKGMTIHFNTSNNQINI